eukprot:3859936-Pleurochrysis_carterae.AAC.3
MSRCGIAPLRHWARARAYECRCVEGQLEALVPDLEELDLKLQSSVSWSQQATVKGSRQESTAQRSAWLQMRSQASSVMNIGPLVNVKLVELGYSYRRLWRKLELTRAFNIKLQGF